MKYFVTIEERVLEVDLDGTDVRVDGVLVGARVERVSGTPEVRLFLDGVAHTLAVEAESAAGWRLVSEGAVHDVQIEDERRRHIRLLAGAGKAADRHSVLKAPMPGLVLAVFVAVGDLVAAGTPLLSLEAMKMENELKATGPARVLTLSVAVGTAVEKGQILLELGPADLTETVTPG